MRYTLAVLTHADAPWLAECLASFDDYVQPTPDRTVIVADGPTTTGLDQIASQGQRFDVIHQIKPQSGFCEATKTLWGIASAGDSDFILYLEHDFLFTRQLDLELLSKVLVEQPELAQMSLMRDPVNWIEKAAGSLVNAHPDWYQMHHRQLDPPQRYMTQHAYFSTNVNLMSRQFMADNPWPDHDSECEGKFGIELVAKGYVFGVWGHGEVWTNHIGTRTGFGY